MELKILVVTIPVVIDRIFVWIQRTYRMPKDIHVDPERFAAELISRLETVLREREAEERLEERLKRVRLVSVEISAIFLV